MQANLRSLRAMLFASAALTAAAPAWAQAPATPAPATDTEVEEIIVQGKFIPDQIRDTPEVANFLTIEDVQRAGDDTAAQALTRVTGLSVVSGRFVYVRGLGERYSQALLNGSPLPSPEPLQRVVPLDLFPASILAGTAVQKTFSANYPGEFGGGVIDLQTIGVPDKAYLNVGGSVGFDTQISDEKGLTYYGSKIDETGFDDGARKLPVGVRQFAATRPVVFTGSQGGLTLDEFKAVGRSFNNAPLNLIQRDRIPLNGSLDLAGGAGLDTDYGRVGVVGVLSYRNSWLERVGVRQTTLPDVGGIALASDAQFESNQNDINWSGLGGLAWEFGDNEIRYTGLWIRSTSKRARITQNSAVSSGSANVNSFNTEWFRRELQMSQLSGKHKLGDFDVDWRGTYGRTTREAPYERLYRYGLGANGTRVALLSGANQLVSFSDLDENIATANLDVRYDLPVDFVRQAELRMGLAWQENDRVSVRRDFTYDAGRNWDPARYAGERIDFLVSDRNINDDIIVLRELTGSALTGDTALYNAGLKTYAGYVQIDSEIRPLLRGSIGVRYEDAEETISTFDIFNRAAGAQFSRRISNDYILPAATLTWNFAEDQQLRLGLSKTIGRPQFRELAPQRYRDSETDRILTGNPFLEDTRFKNADLRYEYYFARGQYLTLGGFYKRLDKPVEVLAVLGSDGNFQQTFFNAPSADLYGLEAEVKKYFEFDTGYGWVDGKRWLVAVNYTYTKSELKAGAGDTIVLNTTGVRTTPAATDYIVSGEPLQGQSDHLANLQLGFEDDEAGSQATFLVTYASKRVSARASSIDLPDLVQNPGLRIDFVYRQTFTIMDRELSASFEARNLTGRDSFEYQALNGRRFETNSYKIGQSYSVGLTAKF
ncbi:MAG: TonB-dependent receptor plug domain-containing protein [Phenylobacterium sp.]|uniref:TonB-dependent receptor domain-containing protein n=1 Tax=Phenylobacterium sp. TaxID=1871053 RepID=UPI001A623635|nr:TonB-dependent receptor [Phenylobacterium sp.]MBL8770995.1 TonB-dependent receptor plug domain-containing protein [Phenylobacterium sp.]